MSDPEYKPQLNLITPDTFEKPAGVYIHIPFCQTKCPYCSFVSYAGMDAALKGNYIQALNGQVRLMAAHPWSQGRKFLSLFVGGGNPASTDAEKTAACIKSCIRAFDFGVLPDKTPEVTLEVNPNTVSLGMLHLFRAAGVNRLSIGMQSFSDDLLKKIGRNHTAEDGIKAYELARAAGFNNINLDLMYGLPGQDVSCWEETIRQAVALSPEHFSVYELTIEKGTPFAGLAGKGKLNLPHEDEIIAMFEGAQKVLSTAGYRQYEISNYARPGCECIHNINYWENGSYLGLGAGAVSCFSGLRVKNTESPGLFIHTIENTQAPFAEAEFLPLHARFRETVVMGLRMTAGVSIARLEERFGLSPQQYYGEMLEKLIRQELLAEKEGWLHLTQKGLLLANSVMAHLV